MKKYTKEEMLEVIDNIVNKQFYEKYDVVGKKFVEAVYNNNFAFAKTNLEYQPMHQNLLKMLGQFSYFELSYLKKMTIEDLEFLLFKIFNIKRFIFVIHFPSAENVDECIEFSDFNILRKESIFINWIDDLVENKYKKYLENARANVSEPQKNNEEIFEEEEKTESTSQRKQQKNQDWDMEI